MLLPEGVTQGFHGLAGVDGEAVQVQQDVQLPQGELAVPAEEPQAGGSELDTANGARILADRRHRCLVRAGRPSAPPTGEPRPQLLVDLQGLGDQRPPPADELRRLLVECIEGVDDELATPVQHVPLDPPQPGGVPGRVVRVVLEPPR
jgi:hypothetical protein